LAAQLFGHFDDVSRIAKRADVRPLVGFGRDFRAAGLAFNMLGKRRWLDDLGLEDRLCASRWTLKVWIRRAASGAELVKRLNGRPASRAWRAGWTGRVSIDRRGVEELKFGSGGQFGISNGQFQNSVGRK
jgi:hypothetical protein